MSFSNQQENEMGKQMSQGELAAYTKLQREMLQEAVAVVLEDLKERELSGETRDACTPLGNTRGLLSGVLSSLPKEGGHAAVRLAKAACESLIDRASHAEREGSPELASVLREHINKLLPVVADMLPETAALQPKVEAQE